MARSLIAAIVAASIGMSGLAMSSAQAAPNPTPPQPGSSAGPKVAAGLSANPGNGRTPLGLGPDEDATERSRVVDEFGVTHVRYDRTYRGMRVLGGDFIAAVDSSGAVSELTWHRGMDRINPSQTVSVSREAAVAATARTLAATGVRSSAEQVVWAATGAPRMAWDVLTEGIKPDQTPTRLHTIIDAVTGEKISSYDEVFTGSGKSQYSGTVTINTIKPSTVWQLKDANGNHTTNLAHATTGTGTLLTDADNVWGNGLPSNVQTAGVDAQYGAEKTFAFYKNFLGRNGIWNNGVGARSRVHYGNAYQNAFWDGTQMTYGDGLNDLKPLTSLDVAAHEMTHGVTTNSAGLNMTQESLALNESTSDILATTAEFWVANATDKGDYLIGEKIDLLGTGKPLRYLDRPSRDGSSPDCYSTALAGLDEHFGSGPLNHWFYLLSEGSGTKTINGVSYTSTTCNGSTIAAIGRAKAARIWYRALTTKLTAASDYKMARDAGIAAARELYGVGSPECNTVLKAFTAISVPVGTQTCANTVPAPGANLVKNGGFESGEVYWTDPTNGVITSSSTGRPARTGTKRAWLGGYGVKHADLITQMVSIPATATKVTLRFYLSSDTDETGTTVYDTMQAKVLVGNTAKTLATYTNVGTNAAYQLKTFDLTAYKGKVVTLWFMSTEDATNQTSWLVDDVSMTYS